MQGRRRQTMQTMYLVTQPGVPTALSKLKNKLSNVTFERTYIRNPKRISGSLNTVTVFWWSSRTSDYMDLEIWLFCCFQAQRLSVRPVRQNDDPLLLDATSRLSFTSSTTHNNVISPQVSRVALVKVRYKNDLVKDGSWYVLKGLFASFLRLQVVMKWWWSLCQELELELILTRTVSHYDSNKTTISAVITSSTQLVNSCTWIYQRAGIAVQCRFITEHILMWVYVLADRK